MFPALLICAFMVKNAATQNVSTSLEITKSCVLIGDDVKLLCTVSSGCCSSQFRVWQKVGVVASLLNDGVSLNDSKYVEDYDNGTTGYNLIIKNLQKSDLGANYKCVYGLKSSELFLDGILCTSSEVQNVNESGSSSELNISGDCWECAKEDYEWSVIGTAIGTVIIIIAKLIIMNIAKVKKVKPKTVLIVGVLTFIISAVVNLFALPIGYLVCHCVDGTDLWLILLGLVTSGITGGIIIKFKLMQEPTVKVPRSSYVKTTGDVILECTVTSCLPINSVQWDRNVDGSITTIKSNTSTNKYSGGTATTPSLTICKAASSDKAIKGTYRCFASNCVGTGQSTTITIVPTVKVHVVTTGDDVILECTVTSSLPITSVQWKRNVGGSTMTIDSNTNINKYSGGTATTPSLTIRKAESSDEGTYICFASNCVGTGQSTTITVGKKNPASGKKSKQDGDQELKEKEEKSQPLIK